MTTEWFDRVSAELQDNLESICEKYDQVGHMTIDKGAKHPRIEFFVEDEENERDYFCSLFFDPYNEEFYVESFDIDLEQNSRTILKDIEDIVDAVHESFHEYMNEETYLTAEEYIDEYEEDDIKEDYALEYEMEDDIDDYDYYEEDDENVIDVEVEWETPEVTAYIDQDEELEVTYRFGVIPETGDGILHRTNRIRTMDNELIKDESNFIFSRDEASTIIAMIASHMDSLESLDYDF